MLNQNKKHIHFVGVGGAGMSGLASILLDLDYKISGSDLKVSKITKRLEEKGATIFYQHHPDNIRGANLVVISTAISSDNLEVQAAKKQKIRVIRRAEMLARLVEGKKLIAISGTHGKTTTTSMISLILEKAGLDPLIIVGGEVNNLGGNAKIGRGNYAIAEADESDGSFLKLNPYLAVITNIEDDHLDYYGNMENVYRDFNQFLNKISDNGFAVLCKDCKNVCELIKNCRKKIITYGLDSDADLVAKEVEFKVLSSTSQVYWRKKKLGKLYLNLSGYHNISNALASIAVSLELGIDFEKIVHILQTFSGVERRMQIIAQLDNEIMLMDDYAHHPTEIKVTLKAIKEGWKNRRIIVIFQPHRYTRTKILAHKFGEVFEDADQVIINDIYSANELPISGISGKTIFDQVVRANGHSCLRYIPDQDSTLEYLTTVIQSGDIIVTMGAGDVWKIGRELLNKLENKFSVH